MHVYLPDFYYFYSFNVTLIRMIREEGYLFIEGLEIGAIYGCFPNEIWNGGRVVKGTGVEIDNIINTIRELDGLGICIRFTYTNCMIREEDLDDKMCNFITDLACTGKNEILVNSEILEAYLRDRYGNSYKYISSATRCVRKVDKLNELVASGKYSLVLGDYRDNFDFEYLSKIEQKDKIEILINPYCKQDCILRQKHYEVISCIQLGLPHEEFAKCPCEKLHWYELVDSDHIIKREDLIKYIEMGFTHFKIEGRNMDPIDVIDSYVYYLVKPEYRDKVRNILLRSFYNR